MRPSTAGLPGFRTAAQPRGPATWGYRSPRAFATLAPSPNRPFSPHRAPSAPGEPGPAPERHSKTRWTHAARPRQILTRIRHDQRQLMINNS